MKGGMHAYYNDNEPYVAQWLRNLVAAGELDPGVIDDRSILDVRGSDLAGFRQCHFFAGIGGWAYALALAGWPAGREVWTASCPCQPLSVAGARRGHADRRHLWPALHGLVAERRPAVVLGEQVASRDGREWLAAVRADLEHLGYAVGAADLPAAGVGAPHLRQRLWFVADAGGAELRHDQQRLSRRRSAAIPDQGQAVAGDHGAACSVADADDGGCGGLGLEEHGRVEGARGDLADRCGEGRRGNGEDAAHAGLARLPLPEREELRGAGRGEEGRAASQHGGWTVESPLGRVAHGIPGRVGQLRAYGNAIVPQVAARFIRAYLGLTS